MNKITALIILIVFIFVVESSQNIAYGNDPKTTDFSSFSGRGLLNVIFTQTNELVEIKARLANSGFSVIEDWKNKENLVAEKGDIIIVYRNAIPKLVVNKLSNKLMAFTPYNFSSPNSIELINCDNSDIPRMKVLFGYEVRIWSNSYNGGLPEIPANAVKKVLSKFDLI